MHKHLAEKAGEHSDFRISDGKHAYSWMIRKGFPDPGKMHLAKRQPDHRVSYMEFEGEIKKKYGKGKVKIDSTGTARLLRSNPNKLVFALLNKRDPEEFALIRTKEDDWLMLNRTPTQTSKKEIPLYRPDYEERQPAKVTEYTEDDNYIFQPKIDGAHVLISLEDQPRIYSYRKSSRSPRLIQHTYKIKNLDKVKVPKALQDTILRGELYATDIGGNTIPLPELGALLNATTENSLATQKIMNIKPKIALFDIHKFKDKKVEEEKYSEKLKMLKEIEKFFKDNNVDFRIPDIASTKEQKQKMFTDIEQEKFSKTKEGVIARNLNDNSKPIRIKIRPDFDIYVRGIYPQATGKLKDKIAGGFEYSLTPRGKIIGHVGTGFKHSLKKDMLENPKKYIGRVAKVKALSQFPSGTLRAPAFTGEWHLEKGQGLNKVAFIDGFLTKLRTNVWVS